MIRVFVDQHMRQQTGSWTTAFDGTRWQCGLADLLAAGTGHARTHDPVHDKTPRLVFQLFGHILAESAQSAAARCAVFADSNYGLVARQVIGQWAALWLPFLIGIVGRRLGGRAFRRPCDLLLFQFQFKL